MARCLSTSVIATIVVLANFILVSSALPSHVARKSSENTLIFTEDDVVSQDKTTRHLDQSRANRFIGDLVVGYRRPNEKVYQTTYTISNPTGDVLNDQYPFSIASGIIHYVSVLNEPGSYAVACDTPNVLGSNVFYLKIRVVPNSRSTLTILAAAH